MYATVRQTSDAHRRLMLPTLGAGHNKPRHETAMTLGRIQETLNVVQYVVTKA